VGTPLTPYQRRLFVFLGVATFFEGYDFLALTQILPNLRADLGLSREYAGAMVATINVGTVVAYLLVRYADRWGRRRVLSATIAGYTIATGLSGLAPDPITFTLLQLVARVFLIGEWATSLVYAAEEFPADRRGMVIGAINAFSSLGAIVCAGVVPFLLKTRFGWRTPYFLGVLPLVILIYARRNLRETRRFEEQVGDRAAPRAFTAILRGPYRSRVLRLGLIWMATYVCTQNAVTFWKEFALAERGMTDEQVGMSISIAAVFSMPLVFGVGPLLDKLGRRGGAAIIFVATAFGVAAAYSFHHPVLLTGSLVFAIFGASAVLPVLNAFNTELFPTEIRGDAIAWSNNLIGRIGYVLSPALVGVIAGQTGWGPAVRLTAVFPIVALVMILLFLPETRSRELEDTAALPGVDARG
jgi:MFS transporter, putative metabolite:H+ symporter